MNDSAIVCKLTNVRKHPNADRVQLADALGYQVVVGLEYKEGDAGIYFPTDTCIGKNFAEHNPELLKYFGKNLRVTTQKFRGEKSEGFWCHIGHLPIDVFDAISLKEGTKISTVNGTEVCKKYINPETLRYRRDLAKNISKKLRSGSLPNFQKHLETEQLRMEWRNIQEGRYKGEKVWTLKAHGTSQRVSYVEVDRDLTWYEKILDKLGIPVQKTQYEYLIGTRNVILGELKADGSVGKDGWHGDEFRKEASKPFIGKLNKGEVIYYEIVGYSAFNTPIMSKQQVKDKELQKLYGNEVTYSYNCSNGSFDIYVYRIAYQTRDGVSVDLDWSEVKKRCIELGVKHVHEVDKLTVDYWNSSSNALPLIQEWIEQPDPVDYRHPLEGVVLRIGGSHPKFFKEKSFTFKVLEGIFKDSSQVDLEDAS